MILRFACENYRSYREVAELDMTRRSFRTNRPADEDWSAVTIRRAALYGANASGKSNILLPFGLLADAVGHSVTQSRTLRLLRDPHKQRDAEPTAFEVDYVAEGVRFEWRLQLGRDGIFSESLRANESGYWRTVFDRAGGEISFGSKSGIPRAAREIIRQYATDWALTLSALQLVRDAGPYAVAANWWSHGIRMTTPQSELGKRTAELKRSAPWMAAARAIIKTADLGIADVRINEREVPEEVRRIAHAFNELIRSEELGEVDVQLPDDEESSMVFHYLEFIHESEDGEFTLEDAAESLGTQVWFHLALAAIEALVSGSVLVIDEIDSSLHPVLLRQLVGFFADEDLNESGAQLIFTTHDTSLLSNQPDAVLEKSEIWFVSKFDAGSELVCLDNYSVRDAHNIEKRYLGGAFDAIPVPATLEIRKAVRKLRSSNLAEVIGG